MKQKIQDERRLSLFFFFFQIQQEQSELVGSTAEMLYVPGPPTPDPKTSRESHNVLEDMPKEDEVDHVIQDRLDRLKVREKERRDFQCRNRDITNVLEMIETDFSFSNFTQILFKKQLGTKTRSCIQHVLILVSMHWQRKKIPTSISNRLVDSLENHIH